MEMIQQDCIGRILQFQNAWRVLKKLGETERSPGRSFVAVRDEFAGSCGRDYFYCIPFILTLHGAFAFEEYTEPTKIYVKERTPKEDTNEQQNRDDRNSIPVDGMQN
jgi:hypothetical protein